MKTGDIVIAGKNVFRITGVYLGGVGIQNIVGLESLVLNPGYATPPMSLKVMYVPEELVLLAGVYRQVD